MYDLLKITFVVLILGKVGSFRTLVLTRSTFHPNISRCAKLRRSPASSETPPPFKPSLDGMLVHGKEVGEDGTVSISKEELDKITSSQHIPTSSSPLSSSGLQRREVQIDNALSISVYELEDPSALVQNWMSER